MSKLAEAIMISHLTVPKLATVAFVRNAGWGWFPRRRARRGPVTDVNPMSLVALADLELAAGHQDEAKLLLEAAYVAFDYRL